MYDGRPIEAAAPFDTALLRPAIARVFAEARHQELDLERLSVAPELGTGVVTTSYAPMPATAAAGREV